MRTQKLPPSQRRALKALLQSPQGIRSYDLGRIAHTMYPGLTIQKLRKRGIKIETILEPYLTQDGAKIRIALYRLDANNIQNAASFLK